MQQRSSRLPLSPAALLTLLIVALLAGAGAGAGVAYVLDDDGETEDGDGGGAQEPLIVSGSYDEQVAEAVQRALPSVVTIVSELPDRRDPQGRIIERLATGTGFIVDERGYIVTNEHVVHDAGRLTVVLSNGEEREAELVSHDAPFTDIAVIKIPEGGLRAIRVADSARLQPGQKVIAIGTALFEFRNSVTVGVVSGLERRWLRAGVYMEDLIQTDVALNSGNSGGPLITLDGAAVGINSTVIRTIGDETVLGVSFAISSRTFQPIARTIIENGRFPRPYFGIEHLNVEEALAAGINPGIDRGALVQQVFSGSPAADAGIEIGDVILRLGNRPIDQETTFINALASVGVDESVEVEVLRGGNVFTTVAEMTPRE